MEPSFDGHLIELPGTGAGLARRPWLSALLPSRAALLRAPLLKHVILEDWLLEQGKNLTGDTED